MPRDSSNIYVQPFPNVIEGTTIESAVYNGFTADVATDLNTPRPVVAGGTGSTNADDALDQLGAEKAGQQVTNFDSHAWVPGSFYALSTATAPPVAAHAFAGLVYMSDDNNIVVEATDQDDTQIPPRKYIRMKKAGVWGTWAVNSLIPLNLFVPIAGGTMTGQLKINYPGMTTSGDINSFILNIPDAPTIPSPGGNRGVSIAGQHGSNTLWKIWPGAHSGGDFKITQGATDSNTPLTISFVDQSWQINTTKFTIAGGGVNAQVTINGNLQVNGKITSTGLLSADENQALTTVQEQIEALTFRVEALENQ